MSSSRLPGKSLLPVSGIPLSVLCVKRVANCGSSDVILVTSTDRSDDVLADEAARYGVKVFRGSLGDVLGRYVAASDGMSDQDLVIRLTADNPFVDSAFLEQFLECYLDFDCDYLGTSSPSDGLPYGLSAEIMTVEALRSAGQEATSDADREHVTPWIRRKRKAKLFDGRHLFGGSDMSHLRCTVDTLDDYTRVCEVFREVSENPETVSYFELVRLLSTFKSSVKFRIPYREKNGIINSVIALGTVQFGLDYGIANSSCMLDAESVSGLINLAADYGVTWIDTARAYGLAESRVGSVLTKRLSSRVRVVTKLSPLEFLTGEDASQTVLNAVEKSLLESRCNLGVDRLDVVLLHRWSHRYSNNENIWKCLLEKKKNSEICELGASVYDPEDLLDALNDMDVTHVQIPFNLLDSRWLSDQVQSRLAERGDVRIHARSVFLQGLLVSDESLWPDWVDDVTGYIDTMNAFVQEFDRKDIVDLCLAYVLGNKWVDSAVLGVDDVSHLEINMQYACNVPLDSGQCEKIANYFSDVPERLLNPAEW